MTNGNHTLNEILTQANAWEDALQAFYAMSARIQSAWQALQPQQVVFTGCGSTHYLSQTAAELFQSLTSVPSRAYPASEIALYPQSALTDPAHTLLIAVSRSGATTETIQAIKRFEQAGGAAVWSITCYPNSPIAQSSALILLAEAGQEESVAQTRSFASMLVLAQALAALLGAEDVLQLKQLPNLGRQLIAETESQMKTLGSDAGLERFFFLGSGLQYGIANEAMLKMKEMSLSHSEAFHFMEFRHGPMSMVNQKALVVGLLSQQTHRYEQKVLSEMKTLGGRILSLTTEEPADGSAYHITLPKNLPAWAMPALYLPPLQLLAYYRAVSKGLNPDNPRNLTAVVYLDETDFEA